MSKKDFEPHYRVFTNNKDFVKVGCSYAGKMYYGVARCNPEDEFDYQTGYDLAKARCDFMIVSAKLMRCHEKIDMYVRIVDSYNELLDSEMEYEAKIFSKEYLKYYDNLVQLLEGVGVRVNS